jgi:hypothetical protein
MSPEVPGLSACADMGLSTCAGGRPAQRITKTIGTSMVVPPIGGGPNGADYCTVRRAPLPRQSTAGADLCQRRPLLPPAHHPQAIVHESPAACRGEPEPSLPHVLHERLSVRGQQMPGQFVSGAGHEAQARKAIVRRQGTDKKLVPGFQYRRMRMRDSAQQDQPLLPDR